MTGMPKATPADAPVPVDATRTGVSKLGGPSSEVADGALAVSRSHRDERCRQPALAMTTLRNRRDFLRAARARRMSAPAFLLQARNRGDSDPALRVGFTCSKKVGNAVARNRAKRRLRAIARAVLPAFGAPGHDYVLIGRADATANRDFTALVRDLELALKRLHDGRDEGRRR